MKQKHILLTNFLILLALLLTSCRTVSVAPQPTVAAIPTEDINLIRTQAAQTVIAQITQEAALLPTATSSPLPPPPPPPPVETPTLYTIATATSLPTSAPSGSGGGWVVQPTITKTYYTDSAVLLSQSIADGIVVAPGQDLNIKWVFKNTGARDWNTKFYFRWMGGTMTTADTSIHLRAAVPRGAEYDFIAFFEAPRKPGIHVAKYCLYNDDGVCFYNFYFSIKVTE